MDTTRNRAKVLAQMLRAVTDRIRWDDLSEPELQEQCNILDGIAEEFELEAVAATPDPAGGAHAH